MPKCPCCAGKLLRHVRHGKIYWFCSHCWQEMPDLASQMVDRSVNLSDRDSSSIAIIPH